MPSFISVEAISNFLCDALKTSKEPNEGEEWSHEYIPDYPWCFGKKLLSSFDNWKEMESKECISIQNHFEKRIKINLLKILPLSQKIYLAAILDSGSSMKKTNQKD